MGSAPNAASNEDDLKSEHGGWDWIYEDVAVSQSGSVQIGDSNPRKRKASLVFQDNERRIIGATKGDLTLKLGDAVLLKAARNEQWVALIHEFLDDDLADEKEAKFMWFTAPKDIRNKAKRRTDALPNEIYLTAEFDENSLNTILDKANVVSADALRAKYPSGKIPKTSSDRGKTFVCRRGVTARTATYTEEWVWEDVFHGAQDLNALFQRIKRETQVTRSRALQSRSGEDLADFTLGGADKEVLPRTPRQQGHGTEHTHKIGAQRRTINKLTTPTHKRPLEFTPLGTRVSDFNQQSSPYQLARTKLHVSSVPVALPCRETEFSEVYRHLESAIIDGIGTCIYISGMPGTGKTATVREVIAQLSAAVRAEDLDDFIFVEINGMKVTDPHQSYSLLWEALMGERVSPTVALALLEREFSSPSPRRVPCVVLMDELDQLVTKSQSVMYNFFNWPNLRHSRLIVLAVANTMDLPERTLSNKISSRLGLIRITFQSYTHEQLMSIIQSRLEGVPGDVIDPEAVQFASRKVAQVSGDARRALDMCRRAVEIAEAQSEDDLKIGRSTGGNPGRVTIDTIRHAIREATSTPLQEFLRHLPLAAKVFLAALLARSRRTGVAECRLGDVLEEAKRLSTMTDLVPLRRALLSGGNERLPRILAMNLAVAQLSEGGVVLYEVNRGERSAKVRLSIGEDEVQIALKDDATVRGLGFSA